MANGVDPNDIYHNGGWYNRNGSGPNTPITPTTSTWATRPSAAAAAGSAYLMTDVGAGQLGTGGGTLWMSNGTKWKLSNNDALIDAVDSANSSNGTTTPAQQQLNPNHNPIFAGMISQFDRLDYEITTVKAGTTSSATIRIHLGTTGTTSDQVIQTFSDMATTSQKGGYRGSIKRDGTTTVQVEGNNNSANPFSGATTGGQQASFTVGNFDTQTQYLSISSQVDLADTVTLVDYRLKLCSTDS